MKRGDRRPRRVVARFATMAEWRTMWTVAMRMEQRAMQQSRQTQKMAKRAVAAQRTTASAMTRKTSCRQTLTKTSGGCGHSETARAEAARIQTRGRHFQMRKKCRHCWHCPKTDGTRGPSAGATVQTLGGRTTDRARPRAETGATRRRYRTRANRLTSCLNRRYGWREATIATRAAAQRRRPLKRRWRPARRGMRTRRRTARPSAQRHDEKSENENSKQLGFNQMPCEERGAVTQQSKLQITTPHLVGEIKRRPIAAFRGGAECRRWSVVKGTARSSRCFCQRRRRVHYARIRERHGAPR
jgi:hypothetical protein